MRARVLWAHETFQLLANSSFDFANDPKGDDLHDTAVEIRDSISAYQTPEQPTPAVLAVPVGAFGSRLCEVVLWFLYTDWGHHVLKKISTKIDLELLIYGRCSVLTTASIPYNFCDFISHVMG